MAKIFSENFESNDLGLYNVSSSDATITTSSDQAHSGTYSLKCDITSNDGSCELNFLGRDGLGEFYMRFWVYFDSDLTDDMGDGDSVYLFYTFDAGYTTSPLMITLLDSGGDDYIAVAYDDWNGSLWANLPATDTWHCIEVYYKQHDTDQGEVKFWLNGVLQDEAIGVDSGSAEIGHFWFGTPDTTSVTAAVYLDDIVIDSSKYIGTGYHVSQDGATGSPYHT